MYLLFFTSKNIFKKIKNNDVVFDVDNQSDHNVIVLLLYAISSHLFVPTTSHNSSINCNWSKAAQADIKSYQNCLNSNLDIIDIPYILGYNNNNNICLKSNIQTSSVDYAPRELTHACSRSETCSRSDTEAYDMCYVF